jgi:hypothetical protein
MGAFLKRADFIIPAGYGQAFWKLFAWLYQSQEFCALTSRSISKYAVFAKFSRMTPRTSNLVKRLW